MFEGCRALITGASAGIGRELARCLAEAGAQPLLVARRVDRLKALTEELRVLRPDCAAEAHPADLAADGVPEALAAQLLSRGPVDLLVNNAGVGDYGPFVRQDAAAQGRMLAVNVTALVRLTRAVLPGMVERRRGWVLNVASMAGFQPMPYLSVYSAAKAFVVNFSLGLREELRRSGVVVTCVCPGTVRTEFFDNESFSLRRDEFRSRGMDAARAARLSLRALGRARALYVPGRSNALSAFFQRVLPARWMARLVGGFLRPADDGGRPSRMRRGASGAAHPAED